MAEGQRINLTFIKFNLKDDAECEFNFIEINYSSRHCGHTQKPWNIISNGNTMFLRYSSSDEEKFTGFEAIWTPTTAPQSFNFDIGFGCQNCNFPFLFEGRRYQSCANIDKDKVFCTRGIIPPTEDGIHISLAPPTKFLCYDRDSSCHRTPKMSTHPNNQHGNCCKFHKKDF